MKLRPLGDRVVVSRLSADDRSRGGIIIPDAAKERPERGIVIAVGPGARNEDGTHRPVDVQPGDQVLFSKYAGVEIKLGGEEYTIVREDDITAHILTEAS